MARAAAGRGLPFLHVATDHVVDGTPGRPRREHDPSPPLNVLSGAFPAPAVRPKNSVLDCSRIAAT